jgi:polyisoprenoid-binding protein YceI
MSGVMNKISCVGFLILITLAANAQKYMTEKSLISFYSEAPVENISAKNSKSTALLDVATGQVAFSIPIIDFIFPKHLMQEHFNEKYMESEKFPKATFQGQIINLKSDAPGLQNVTAKGKLTIHGVTREVEIPGTFEFTSDSRVLIKSAFKVLLKDYKIKIPQLLWQNIAEEIEVKVDFTLKPKS